MKRVSINRFSGGLINKINPQRIPDNAMTEIENYEYRKSPIPKKRFGIDDAELNQAGITDIYNFDIWYSGRKPDDMVDDKIFVIHTKGSGGGGNGDDPDLTPTLVVIPDAIQFGYVLVDDEDTDTYTLIGTNLIQDVTVTSNDAHFTILDPSDDTYKSTFTLSPVGGYIEQTMTVKVTPDAYEELSSTVDHTSSGCSAPLLVTAEGIELPQQDKMLWWLETFNEADTEMMTIVDDEVTEWESILPTPVVTFVPVSGASGTPSAAQLTPDATTANLLDAETDTDVVDFSEFATNQAKNLVGSLVNLTDGIGYGKTLDGLTFVSVINNKPAVLGTVRVQCMSTLSGTLGYRKYIQFYLYNHVTNLDQIRIEIWTSAGSSTIAGVTIDSLDSAGWLLLVGQYIPQADGSRKLKVYIGTSETITEYDLATFSSPSVDINSATLTTVKGAIGCAYTGVSTQTPQYSAEAEMPTNDAWGTVLTETEVKQVFKYYKLKYPNIFSYDPDTIT